MIYGIAINLVTFLVYGIDKWKAKKNGWRIPEKTLLLLAFLGGSIGAFLGMRVFHHKTLKWKFRIGIPLVILLQLAIIVFLYLQFQGGV